MRPIYIVCMLFMVFFAALQYNDPDGGIWMLIYAVPAVWTAIAAFRHSWLGNKIAHFALLFCTFASVAGMLYLWPKSSGWWRQDQWWHTEVAREVMGLMVVAMLLVFVWAGRPRSPARVAQPIADNS